MAGMYCMDDLLELILREGADELRLKAGTVPSMVIHGESIAVDVPETSLDNVTELFESMATEDQLAELRTCGDIHFVHVFQKSTRFAVTATLQREAFDMKIKNLGRGG